ncbi:MAG TPA: ATP-binding protein [Sphingomicrobium sp.]|nr:ATP-binding protein [Sphingomicrobium sp.]
MIDFESFGDRYWQAVGAPSALTGEVAPETVNSECVRAVADYLPSLCWLARADGYIVWYNQRWHDYCGSTPQSMEGWGWQSVHDPEVLPKVVKRWTKCISSGEPFEMTFPLRGADGRFRPFLTRVVPLRDQHGVVQRWVGNNVDVSEQHRMEAELRAAQKQLQELNRSLEARVEDRARQHEATQEQLRQSQKLESVGQLTGGIAHDFNNFLTVIRGSVDLLRREDLSAEKRMRYVEAIGSTADRAAKLTSQLLAFARRQSLRPTLFGVRASLQESVDMISTLAGSRIVINLEMPSDEYFVISDRNQFEAAIINMAVNARDAMNGAGVLTIAMGPVSGIPALRAHPPVVGDFVAITIADNGCGMTEEVRRMIFEPFFTSKRVGQGTGLGLSQVFGFAKQSGGDIRVDSKEGRGSTFTLYLPRAEREVGATSLPDVSLDNPEGKGIRVLIVEDNELVGQFAVDALRQLGYICVIAENAASALAELQNDSSRFDIVFSDVVMPGMSGLELGLEIRRLYPSLPVVLTSGYSHVLAQNGQHGFELLHKPYSIDQLARVFQKSAKWGRGTDGLPK